MLGMTSAFHWDGKRARCHAETATRVALAAAAKYGARWSYARPGMSDAATISRSKRTAGTKEYLATTSDLHANDPARAAFWLT